jgi:hypothetical protein
MPLPTRAPSDAPTRTPTIEQPEVRPDPSAGDGDHDRFTHYVSKRELDRSRRKGTPVTALCGKRWIPDGDPKRYEMCPTCAELAADRLTRGFGR